MFEALEKTLLSIIHPLYIAVTLTLSAYSANLIVLTLLFWWRKLNKKDTYETPALALGNVDWPVVAVQLPVYNEKQIAVRVIDQVVKLDYPPDRLHIQVLDDSTDETVQYVRERVDYWKSQGVWITLHHRAERLEYKAGALRDGLASTPANLVAVFDADFLPPTDWLKKTLVPMIQPGGEKIGFVQTRWSHLNDRYSFLTAAQALALDAHFGIEQPVCTSYGFLNYMNGTGFILRRACAEEAGNWSGETLVEDLDLCIRAQLCGWKGAFLRDVSAPAELPGMFIGFKNQQYRWAKGTLQVFRRLGWKIISSRLPIRTRLQAIFHMIGYLLQPLMLLLLFLALPLYMWSNDWLVELPLNSLGIIGMGVPIYYISAHLTLYPPKRWKDLLLRLPAITVLGLGITVNNTLGLLDALMGGSAVFERTPKLGTMEHERMNFTQIKKPAKFSKGIWLEIIFALYALGATAITLMSGNLFAPYFFAMYVFGFSWIAVSEILDYIAAVRNSR